MLRPTIWLFDASLNGGIGGYIDLSDSINTDSNFNFLSDVADKIYIGLSHRFSALYVDLATSGNYIGISYSFIKAGDIFGSLALIDNYTFSNSKYQRWNMPSDWIKFNFTSTSPHNNVTPPDTIEQYWIRIGCSSITTMAVIDKLRVIPFVEYTSPTKVSEFLQLKKDFDNDSKPTDIAVENLIRRAEEYIDYKTRKSWKFRAVTMETDPILVDYNRYGFFLRHRNFSKVYSVQLWNGSSWNILTEGRQNDYFVNHDLGMIYMTRLFLLPAAYGMTGRYNMYGMGEFKNSVKVDYICGRDNETDPEFYIVEDIATKIVAKDLLQHHDYSSFIVSGTDKISLSEKVQLLNEDIEQKIDSLTGIAGY